MKVYELSQAFCFEAAHTLYCTVDIGSSRRIHGHTYHAEVTLRGPVDADKGMVLDLGLLRASIERVRERLDHHFLDEVEGIGPATLENLCSFIHRHIEVEVPNVCAVMVERRATGDRCVLRVD